MADGVDAAEDLLRHRVGQRRGVPQRVQDVQRQPADAEDRADPESGNRSSGFCLTIFGYVLRGCFWYSVCRQRTRRKNDSVTPDTERCPEVATKLGDPWF